MDGGLGIFSRHNITAFKEYEWPSTPSLLESPTQGFIFARIEVLGTPVPVAVDVYVLHSYGSGDGCKEDCHRKELAKLAEKIHEHSSTSGNPVIVMGDFNIDGPSDDLDPSTLGTQYDGTQYPTGTQYGNVIETELRMSRDLWLEYHPGELGHTKRPCNDPSWECWGISYNEGDPYRRIDYIFIPTDPYLTNSAYEIVVRNRDDVAVKSFVVPGYGIHVSDHVGLEATIEIRKRQGVVSLPGNVLLSVDLG